MPYFPSLLNIILHVLAKIRLHPNKHDETYLPTISFFLRSQTGIRLSLEALTALLPVTIERISKEALVSHIKATIVIKHSKTLLTPELDEIPSNSTLIVTPPSDTPRPGSKLRSKFLALADAFRGVALFNRAQGANRGKRFAKLNGWLKKCREHCRKDGKKKTEAKEKIPRLDVADFNIKFEVVKKLGEGGFGDVVMVKCKHSNRDYAMKLVDRKEKSVIRNESAIFTAARGSSYLINLQDVFEIGKKTAFIMELADGGDLKSLLERKGWLGLEEAKGYAAQLVSAIEYLHSLDIVHRSVC
jgi:hypothetical protein